MQEPGDTVSRGDALELISTRDVASLGRHAHERKRRVSGDDVYYLTGPSEPVSLDDFPDSSGELDVLLEYDGGPGDEMVRKLDRVREHRHDTEVRCVELRPVERTTAYDDLRVVGVARLYLEDVGVRLGSEVGDKLAQTALEFGADDVGYVGDYEVDVELLIKEAGFNPVERDPFRHD